MSGSWDDYRYFLAIARTGSLTGAAKLLCVSQPTVSRRLDAMERGMGQRLFTRTRKGYELTLGGTDYFEAVARAEEALLQADRNLFGHDQEIAGRLRFTGTEVFVNGYLGPHLWAFLRNHPEIELDLLCTQSLVDIGRGEADIAIRFTDRPPEHLIGRRLGTVVYGVYVAAGPLGKKLLEKDADNLPWIGLHSETFNRRLYGTLLPSARPRHQVDNMAAMQAMVGAGLAVSILPCYTADRDENLRRLNTKPLTDPKFDIWMLYHPDARRTRRLRLFAEFLARRIRADTELFEGRTHQFEGGIRS